MCVCVCVCVCVQKPDGTIFAVEPPDQRAQAGEGDVPPVFVLPARVSNGGLMILGSKFRSHGVCGVSVVDTHGVQLEACVMQSSPIGLELRLGNHAKGVMRVQASDCTLERNNVGALLTSNTELDLKKW